MPARYSMHHKLCEVISDALGEDVPRTSVKRLALLVLGIMASGSCVIRRVAMELAGLKLSEATEDSIERRLRRTLSDVHLEVSSVYRALLVKLIPWGLFLKGNRWLILSVDETTKNDELHQFRVSLTFHGRAVALASIVWKQNEALPSGMYWEFVDIVLTAVAEILPEGAHVFVTADRAYDIPPFVDRLAARGWHWGIRAKENSSLCFLDHQGHEYRLGELVKRHVRVPGMRWKARGKVFKDAGWRDASVVAIWAAGYKEKMVILTDLKPAWEVLALFDRRFWIEPSFRDDKSKGWQWEDSHVQGMAHNYRLLMAMEIATLITLCLGVQEAQDRLAALPKRRRRKNKPMGQPRPAKDSLFGLGLLRAHRWIHHNLRKVRALRLIPLPGASWERVWHATQSNLLLLHYRIPVSMQTETAR